MAYIIETTTGEKLEAHSAPYSSEQIDELLGRVLNEDVGGGVFWAEYGVTTAAEIITAANAGKLCVVNINGTVYVLAYISGTSYARFAQTSSYLGNSSTTTIECSGSSWRSWTVTNEMTSDKVQAISSKDATSKYPSSPAVQAYVEENASLYVYHTSGPDRLSDILAAHEAGRPCVLIDDTFPENGFYQLHSIDSQKATFVASPTKILNLPAGDRILSVPFYIVYENGASGSYYGAELYANKVQQITEADTIAKYPSSPAVQEYVAPVKDAALGAYVTPTASGAVASFDDGADELPVKSLVVDIEPVQDLNGYANPWPPGGGKNLLDAPETISFSVTIDFPVAPISSGSTVYVRCNAYTYPNGIPASGQQSPHIILRDASGEPVGGRWLTDSGSFVVTGDAVSARIYSNGCSYADSGGVEVEIQGLSVSVEELTEWTPYSNICPISGWTSVQITREGEGGSDAQTYSISLSAAGAVYGGTLDGNNGVLTVTSAMWDLGTLSWNADTNRPGVYYTLSSLEQLKGSGNVLCSQYAFYASFVTTSRDYYISLAPSYGSRRPYIRDTRFAGFTGAQVKQELNGVQAVFELATPVTYQLDPIEVNTLLGVNNIYADAGDTSVTYRADPTKIYEKIMNALLTMTGGT